jgi:hypothetical protein
MEQEWQWIIGLGVTLSLGWGSILAGVFWKIMAMIGKADDQAKEGDKELHGRITRLREDTVHKTDLTELSARLSKDLHEIRDEQRTANNATNLRLDALLNAIANRNDGRPK